MVLKLGSRLTLANAIEVKQSMLGALSAGGDLTLDAGDLTDVDVAGLQLLCATHRLAVAKGQRVTFAGGSPKGVAAAAASAGFGPGRGCAADCLCAGGQE